MPDNSASIPSLEQAGSNRCRCFTVGEIILMIFMATSSPVLWSKHLSAYPKLPEPRGSSTSYL